MDLSNSDFGPVYDGYIYAWFIDWYETGISSSPYQLVLVFG
jgi:hypothetical protein